MAFSSRKEILFVYTVEDANPNGCPLNANHPRFDEVTEQVLVSDVRIKRTIRDEWVRQGETVFVDGEPKTLNQRFGELKESTGKESGREVMADCIDSRLFGVTFALGKESFAWTGPVQFKWGRSLHPVIVDFVQGTSAFATEREGVERQQRSFRNEYKVPFAVIAAYGIANQYASERTGAQDKDLGLLRSGLWNGTQNLITRSKNEHMPRLLLEVGYKEGFAGKIGSLDEKINFFDTEGRSFDKEEGKALRSISECCIDLTPLANSIEKYKDYIESITLLQDVDTRVMGLEEMENTGVKIIKAGE